MKTICLLTCLVTCLFFCAANVSRSEEPALIVCPATPGVTASPHYAVAIRTLSGDRKWQTAFASITRSRKTSDGDHRYFKHLSEWTNTFVNFEMNEAVEIAIARVDRQPITKAVAHPRRKVTSCEVRQGRVFITLEKPCQFTVDIDGQMDDQDTGMGYSGPPIHTLTIFANPLVIDRPDPNDDDVFAVSPGTQPPDDGDWKTLYFLPGVHDIGVRFRIRANRSYYIPGDAVVHGTLSNHDEWGDGHDIRIFGYGVLSGERIDHPQIANPRPEHDRFHNPIHIAGPANTTVEGITVVDSPHHSVMLPMAYAPEKPANVRWLKILAWRANGDGVNPFGNVLMEDCFIRTQDDSMYVSGRGIRRVTCWNDANGSSFVLSALPNRRLIVEDCDVIYARAHWHHWAGGRVFNMRGEGGGDCGAGVEFRNINVEDPRPTLQTFFLAMKSIPPYMSPDGEHRKPGNLSGVLFRDITVAAPSVLGEPDILWGAEDAKIANLRFQNLIIGGEKIDSLDRFKINEHVEEISFE